MGSDCELDTGWMVNTSPKGMESKKPIKIEETLKFPENAAVVQSCSKNPIFFAAWDPPGEPRPHQRLQALARRAEAAEEEL